MDLLGLQALQPVSSSSIGGAAYVSVEPTHRPTCCPTCLSDQLHRHGTREQKYNDVPHYGEPSVLVVHRKRWRCMRCKTLFPDPLPDIDEKRRCTKRLIEFVQSRIMEHTFSSISRDVGLSDVSIRHIFDDFVSTMEQKYHFQTPRFLGIDEVKIIGQYRCILTNVEKNTVYDLLPSRRIADLRKYFANFENPKDVEVFSTDLWANYAAIAQEYFPHATVVADRFHIQRMGTNGMESARKEVRKTLDRKDRLAMKDDRFILLKHREKLTDQQKAKLTEMLQRFPTLQLAWECKEQFMDVWKSDSRYDAEQAVDAWLAQTNEFTRVHFKEAVSAFTTRRNHILNYFDVPVTNAYTESINRLAKSINRMGRGYSFEVVRAKMIYDTNAIDKGTLIKRAAEPKQQDIFDSGKNVMSKVAFHPEKETTEKVYYGAHIPTLCDKLERGEFDHSNQSSEESSN